MENENYEFAGEENSKENVNLSKDSLKSILKEVLNESKEKVVEDAHVSQNVTQREKELIQRGRMQEAHDVIQKAIEKFPEAKERAEELQDIAKGLIKQGSSDGKIEERIYQEARRIEDITQKLKAEYEEKNQEQEKTLEEKAEVEIANIQERMGKPIVGDARPLEGVDAINSAKDEKELREVLSKLNVHTVE